MKRFFKKSTLMLLLSLVLVISSSVTALAVSCKNPTVKADTCPFDYGSAAIYLHSGHKLAEVKIDGKKISLKDSQNSRKNNYDKCANCNAKRDEYHIHLSKGKHHIEVKDNKGYWIDTYVNVKHKTPKWLVNEWASVSHNGWEFL